MRCLPRFCTRYVNFHICGAPRSCGALPDFVYDERNAPFVVCLAYEVFGQTSYKMREEHHLWCASLAHEVSGQILYKMCAVPHLWCALHMTCLTRFRTRCVKCALCGVPRTWGACPDFVPDVRASPLWCASYMRCPARFCAKCLNCPVCSLLSTRGSDLAMGNTPGLPIKFPP